MKRFSVKSVALLSMTAAALLVLGCASAPAEQGFAAQAPAAAGETGVRIQALPTTIIDWQGRAAMAPAVPDWVQDLALENWDGAARRLGYDAGGPGAPIFRGFIMNSYDLRGAQMRLSAEFARVIARELHQNIEVHLASVANSMSGPTTEAIGEQLQLASQATISGAQQLREFWQVVEIIENNRPRRQTIVYRLYRFEAADWAAITAGYLASVVNALPVHQRPEQAQVQEMLQHTLNQSRAHEALTPQQLEAQLVAQQNAIGAQQAQGPAPRDAAAFASPDPVARTAASTTVADAPAVEASALAFGILF